MSFMIWLTIRVVLTCSFIDPLEDFHSPQTNAINLLIDLARDRKKHTFMGILTFINGVLNKYLETPVEQRNGREKDGALCMIGCLADQILRKKSPVAGMMEPFFVTHVIPEFKSPFPYLRARACDITKHFSDLDYANEQVRSIVDSRRSMEVN